MGAAFELQKAIFTMLSADAALLALLADHASSAGKKAIYDDVPQVVQSEDPTKFPYVVLADATDAEWDADDFYGRESTQTIHSFSRYKGMKELKAVMDAIKTALHNVNLAVLGEFTVLCFWEFAEVMLEPDGVTRHGVQRFRVITIGT